MMRIEKILFILLAITASSLSASEVYISTPDHQSYVVDVTEYRNVKEFKQSLEGFIEVPAEFQMIIHQGRVVQDHEPVERFVGEEVIIARNTEGSRDYYQVLSQSEQDDIRYIISTLANKSLISLWGYQSSLETTGDRVQHVHPLLFIKFIFADPELALYMKVIKDRSWVWDEFVDGLGGSFQKEADRGNLKKEYVVDLGTTLKIKPEVMMPHVENRQWDKLLKSIIAHQPKPQHHYDL